VEGFFFIALVGIGIAAVVVSATAKRRQAINAAWGDAAARLHLMFRPADLVTGPQISGAIRGCSVQVTTFTRSSDKARCVRYRIEYRTPHRGKLEIRERGRLTDIRKIFGQDFVEFGDAEFDRKFEVHAPDTEATREFLNPLRRRRLLDLYGDFPGTVIERHRLTWDTKPVPASPATLARAIERLAAAAGDLSPGADRRAVGPGDRPSSRKLGPRAPEPGRIEPARPTPPRPAAPVAPTAAPPSPPPAPKIQAAQRPAPPPPPPPKPKPAPEPQAAPAPEPAPAPAPAMAPATAPSASPPAAAGGTSAADVARAMFGGMAATPDVQASFEREFKDRTVRWAGELTSVARYPFDRVFGSAPGTRAVFHICDVETSLGRRPVQAVVQLPEDAVAGMRTGVGTSWTFEGTLAACDGFMRTLYVTGGRIVSRPPALPGGRPG